MQGYWVDGRFVLASTQEDRISRLNAELASAMAQSERRLDLLREIWKSDDVSWASHRSETFRKLAEEVGE